MKVFLAGCEDVGFLKVAKLAHIQNVLISYYHLLNTGKKSRSTLRDIVNSEQMHTICDSGLFTLMFGVGRGGNYDLQFMRDYTTKYIATAKDLGINNLTIVESDVHKLLGMPAVFELRKYFEDSGTDVIYVWHKEEGIDGLMKMSEKYEYIALSIPELRVILKGTSSRYQTVTHQLLHQIRKHNSGRMPKIHLLGNTVQETMETTLAYSCDSTSWKSGCRWGSLINFDAGKLKTIKRKSAYFDTWLDQVYPKYKEQVSEMFEMYGHTPKTLDNHISNLYSAMTMRQYQEHLDKFFPFIGLRRSHADPR